MTTNVFLNSKPNRKGLYCVFIRLTHERKHFYKSTEIYVKKNQFERAAKYGYWIVGHPDRERLNNALKGKVVEVERSYQLGGEVSPQRAIIADSYFPFAEDFIKKYNNPEQRGTYDTYLAKIAKLKKYAGSNLKFSEITVKFIRDYSTYLKGEGNQVNTIGVDMKKMRAIIRQAVKEDLIEWNKNPFNKIKIESKRTSKEKLTTEELNLIRNHKLLETDYRFHARNVFLFCVNTMGMRIGAALKLKSADVRAGELHYQADKGGKTINIYLTAEAQRIIDCYPDRGLYLFPYLEGMRDVHEKIKSSTALINKGLKAIAKKLEIKKNISTHVSRHTFAKMALDSDVDIRTLQGMLRHSTIKVTEDYAGDIADKASNEALKKIFK